MSIKKKNKPLPPSMVTIHVKALKGFREKTRGLLFAKKAYSILIETRFGIHTFGLLFPIDVLVLDAHNKVVKISSNLKPNRIFLWNPRFNKVLELPEDDIKRYRIQVGDEIKLNYA